MLYGLRQLLAQLAALDCLKNASRDTSQLIILSPPATVYKMAKLRRGKGEANLQHSFSVNKTFTALVACRKQYIYIITIELISLCWLTPEMTILFNDKVIGFNELLKSNGPKPGYCIISAA